MRRLLGRLVCGAVLAGLVSCGPSGPAAPSTGGGETLECGGAAYPCTFAEVDPDVQASTDAVRDQLRERIAAGASDAEITTFLASQADVVESQVEDGTVRFRLKGGRPTWVTSDLTFAHPQLPDPSELVQPESPAENAEWGDAPPLAAATSGGTTRHGVMPRSPRDPAILYDVAGPTLPVKRALVLSPFRWQFGATDDGELVSFDVGAAHGYEGRVTRIANDDPVATAVNLHSFTGWASYQLVHVSSHGIRVCSTDPCRATIVVHLTHGTVGDKLYDIGMDPDHNDFDGVVELSLSYNDWKFEALEAEFFRHEYKGGLAKTIVFFNACETAGPTAMDLANAIAGSTSVFLGWTQVVSWAGAYRAAKELYPRLAAQGFPVGAAVKDMPSDVRTDVDGPRGAILTVTGPQSGGELRLRDVVRLEDPSSGDPLLAGRHVEIHGSIGDGKPDAAPFRVRIDGVTPAQAAKAMLHVSVDGHEAAAIGVDSGTRGPDGSWEVTGEVPLGYDLAAPKVVEANAWLDLPEGGQSSDRVSVELTGTERPTGTEWHGHIEETSTSPGKIVIDATFEYDGIAENGALHYRITDGTFTWSLGPLHVNDCIFTYGGLAGELTPVTAGDSAGLNFVPYGPNHIDYWLSVTLNAGKTHLGVKCPDRDVPGDVKDISEDVTIPVGTDLPEFTGPTLTGSDSKTSAVNRWTLTITWTLTQVR